MKKALSILLFLLATVTAAPAFSIGLLIPNDTSVAPFAVESHRATVVITNNAAVTTVEQVFRNNTDRPMEAVFVFPIPEGGTVSDFSLWIEGKKTAGAVLEKNEARQIYESIVRRVRDPGLVEYIDGKIFKASIFPIPPRGTQKLEIKFGQVLQPKGGLYQYRYPLSAGKDYVTAKTNQDFTLTATVNSSIPITTVYSPSHKIDMTRKKNGQVVAGVEELQASLDRDFDLFLGYSEKEIGVNLMTHDPDGDGEENPYFMLAIAPKVNAAAVSEAGQTFTFVMDTSGSMAGEKIEQARETLAFCIQRLKPQDNFNVIRFSTDVEALFANPKPATNEAIKEATAFARGLEPAGGTAIEPALVAAMKQKVAAGQPHQVIFVTDGLPTVGVTDNNGILASFSAAKPKNTRIFTFGVGYSVNTTLLDTIAETGRGRSDYVKPEESMEEAVATLYTRISSPVLTDITIEYGGARVYDVYPTQMPDLFRGDQIVLFGRYRSTFNKPIVVSGKVGNESRTYTYGGGTGKALALDESSSAPLEFMPKLWATRKVGFLLDQIRLNGRQPELETEVVALAKRFGLVTPYTSFLAVDDSEFQQNRPIDMPRGRQLEDSMLGGGDSAPMRPQAAPMQEAKRKAEAFKDFDAESGEGAVAASEATREYRDSVTVKSSATSRQFVANRSFELKSGVWVEEGADVKKAKEVKAFSTDYFNLLKKFPELKSVMKLGDRVVLKAGGKFYKIVP
ncbi:MAG: VIT domain-containing protein [bacterium]